MENGIRIGNDISRESAVNLQRLIESVFKVGYRTRMEQTTIREALLVIKEVASVNNSMVSGCNISGDKIINT